MAIQISCPSCRSEAAVDDSLAGKDVICPHCQGRITVPSLAAAAPEERRAPVWDDSAYTEREPLPRESLPRYRGADDDYRPRRDEASAWAATATGLGLIFWSGAVMTVLIAITNLLTMFVGNNPQAFGMGMGAGGAAPGPGAMAVGALSLVALCGNLILAVVMFVGMCMCCTAPPESGARGKAITAVVATVLLILGVIVFWVGLFIVAFREMRQMGGPAPGQMPFSPAILLAVTVATGVAGVILVALWMLFHKAVAEHFQYPGLARASVWFIVAYLAFTVIGQVLNLIANPQMLEGNMLAPPPNPALAMMAQALALLGMVALSVWFLVIVRETRRTILGTNDPEQELAYGE